MTRRLSTKIQNNQHAYQKHLSEIELLHGQLCDSTNQLIECRSEIGHLRAISKMPLDVIQKSRHRNRVGNIREILYGLRTLIQLEQTLHQLLRRSDYTEAIKLMQNCKNIGNVDLNNWTLYNNLGYAPPRIKGRAKNRTGDEFWSRTGRARKGG